MPAGRPGVGVTLLVPPLEVVARGVGVGLFELLLSLHAVSIRAKIVIHKTIHVFIHQREG